MRYPASEKLEIIRLVEQSSLPVKRTLEMLGVSRPTFYRWYDLYRRFGETGLADRTSQSGAGLEPHPRSRASGHARDGVGAAGAEPERACGHVHRRARLLHLGSQCFRLLRAHDLITSPAFIVMKAADEFTDKTTAPNQLWQTDFTYLKVIGWGWFYLSTILDDFSRYIIAWKLCTAWRTMTFRTR